jgi:hypothetical protein
VAILVRILPMQVSASSFCKKRWRVAAGMGNGMAPGAGAEGHGRRRGVVALVIAFQGVATLTGMAGWSRIGHGRTKRLSGVRLRRTGPECPNFACAGYLSPLQFVI